MPIDIPAESPAQETRRKKGPLSKSEWVSRDADLTVASLCSAGTRLYQPKTGGLKEAGCPAHSLNPCHALQFIAKAEIAGRAHPHASHVLYRKNANKKGHYTKVL
jgi:hypothetical protein